MKRGGQVGAELPGQCEWKFSGQVTGIFHLTVQVWHVILLNIVLNYLHTMRLLYLIIRTFFLEQILQM